MSDLEEINQLVVWERQTRVRGLDADNLATYWPDATVTTSWQSGPVASFNGQRPVDFATDLPIVSRVSTPVIHLNAQKGRAYVELPTVTKHWLMMGGTQAVLESFMRLIYRVEKRQDEWRISDMSSINEADTLAPCIPGTDLNIDVAKAKTLRPSYRFLAYTRLAAGGTISQDGIGTDRPETVQPVYDKAEEWIK